MRHTALLLSVVAWLGCRASVKPAPGPDRLAIEVKAQSARMRADKATDEISVEIRNGIGPVVDKAEDALRDGRRLLALHRLAFAKPEIDGLFYLRERSAGKAPDQPMLDAEWARMGPVLKQEFPDLGGVKPAVVRGLGEVAERQTRLFYDASAIYGASTTPAVGLFYLGVAAAQRDLVGFLRGLAEPAAGGPPPVRPLGPELDALEAELLAAYRPPISIERHPEFIAASGALKEARELDAAGLRHGALLQYLHAALRTGQLRTAAPPDPKPIRLQLRGLESRLSDGKVDSSVGRLFLQIAEDDLETASPEAGPVKAAVIAGEVLPRYFAALEPAAPATPGPRPAVTVTLVRWPFT